MPAEESDRRREAVSDTLAKFPGATETLLLSLFTEEYQDELWKQSATTAGPVDRGDGTSSYRAASTVFTSPLVLDLNGDGRIGAPNGQ